LHHCGGSLHHCGGGSLIHGGGRLHHCGGSLHHHRAALHGHRLSWDAADDHTPAADSAVELLAGQYTIMVGVQGAEDALLRGSGHYTEL